MLKRCFHWNSSVLSIESLAMHFHSRKNHLDELNRMMKVNYCCTAQSSWWRANVFDMVEWQEKSKTSMHFYSWSMNQSKDREDSLMKEKKKRRKSKYDLLKYEWKSLEIVPSIWILHIDLSTFKFILEIITKIIEIFFISNNTLKKNKWIETKKEKQISVFTFGKYPKRRCACSRNNLIRSSSIISLRTRSTRSASTRSSISRC